ncbi:MAG: hypothetical protein IKU30_00650 [Clostridia bacterium]|nr:hypothetical protein [Clostridia bacterium]
MDYREYAKDLLARKNSLISAYGSIKEELNVLEREKVACKEIMNECEVLGRDRSIYEDRFINTLASLDDCRFRLSVVERELRKIEKGMTLLSDYECALIDAFYVERHIDAVEEIMERFYRERSTVYRDKNRALDVFTRSVYGVLQL